MLNKELTASKGVNMSKYVQSVNGVTPDDTGNVALDINAYPTVSTPTEKNGSLYAPAGGTWFCFGRIYSDGSSDYAYTQENFIRTSVAGGSKIGGYTNTGNNTTQSNNVVCIKIA